MKIPYSRIQLTGNEEKYLKEVLESGWLTTSRKAMEFEEAFANFVGAKYACAVNSCTAALHLAVEAIGIKEGDKVLIPTMTFTATAEIVRYLGANPVFCDVEYGTSLLTPSILSEALIKHKDIKAVILVHFGGQSPLMHTSDGTGIVDICRKNNIFLIEDAAHAFPAKFEDKYIGTFGDATCFSFYANKTITTAEGGMLVTNNEIIYKRAKTMRLHGINRDVWNRFTNSNNKCSWEYDIIAPGYKYNMPDINAAIGLAQLEKAEDFREHRQYCATKYFNLLSDISCIDLPQNIGPINNHAWHLFPIQIKAEARVSRNEFIEKMAENGVGTSVHYKPLHRMSYYKNAYKLLPEAYPNAEKIWESTVSLPIYPDLTTKELDYISQTIHAILC
ncbi:MAG: DegT/DnrJ/EryC1/StrS family aminotransferase [Bacteroidales bacterium]|nr:DegT/DnrJ/EryC1/StrS family aminotransferase [Bacteroidales bacterium]